MYILLDLHMLVGWINSWLPSGGRACVCERETDVGARVSHLELKTRLVPARIFGVGGQAAGRDGAEELKLLPTTYIPTCLQ